MGQGFVETYNRGIKAYMKEWFTEAHYTLASQCQDFIHMAVMNRWGNGHNYTGNLINSIGIVLLSHKMYGGTYERKLQWTPRDLSFVDEPYYKRLTKSKTGREVSLAMKDEMTRKEIGGGKLYTYRFVEDYSGQQSAYTPKVDVGNGRYGPKDLQNEIDAIGFGEVNEETPFKIYLIYGVEYANFVEHHHHTLGAFRSRTGIKRGLVSVGLKKI